jgi:hypothetical protein
VPPGQPPSPRRRDSDRSQPHREGRGERLNYSAETIGHRLKKVGLFTRRLGKAGKGLVMDLATTTRVHELAAVYGGVGLDQTESNLHCPSCIENKSVMYVV